MVDTLGFPRSVDPPIELLRLNSWAVPVALAARSLDAPRALEMAIRLANVLECHWAELLGDEMPRLSKREQALIELYRGLHEIDQEAGFRFFDAMAQRPKKVANGD